MTATVTRRKESKTALPSQTALPGKGRSGHKEAEPRRPKLRIVDKGAIKRRARRRAVLGVSAATIAAGVFAVALGYAQLAKGQQQLDSIRSDISQSQAEIARLERDVVLASSPEAIVQQAVSLGMVRAENPVYLTATAQQIDVDQQAATTKQANISEQRQASQDALAGVLADASDS